MTMFTIVVFSEHYVFLYHFRNLQQVENWLQHYQQMMILIKGNVLCQVLVQVAMLNYNADEENETCSRQITQKWVIENRGRVQ